VKGRGHLEDLGIDGRISLLRLILKSWIPVSSCRQTFLTAGLIIANIEITL
jgi:hypothetical protein